MGSARTRGGTEWELLSAGPGPQRKHLPRGLRPVGLSRNPPSEYLRSTCEKCQEVRTRVTQKARSCPRGFRAQTKTALAMAASGVGRLPGEGDSVSGAPCTHMLSWVTRDGTVTQPGVPSPLLPFPPLWPRSHLQPGWGRIHPAPAAGPLTVPVARHWRNSDRPGRSRVRCDVLHCS